jgi:hypothetical protein
MPNDSSRRVLIYAIMWLRTSFWNANNPVCWARFGVF